MSERATLLRARLRWLTWFFIVALVISGVTAIPLESELDILAGGAGGAPGGPMGAGLTQWILRVREALHQTNAQYPFIAYGTDWLAFGHIMIAIVFIGPLRDPVRNVWVYNFGLIACLLVIPWAFCFGAVRGIPMGWRLIDCSFGVFGFIPLWFCRKYALELAQLSTSRCSFAQAD